jgi:signal transduction histidine kinase
MTASFATESPSLFRVALPVAVMLGAMLLLPIGDVRALNIAGPLAFGQTGSLPTLLDLVAGQVLLVAGTLSWLLGPRLRVGSLAVAAGICWFGPDLFALVRAEPLVRTFGRFILWPFLLPLLLHLVTAALGMDRGRRARAGLATIYVAAVVVAVGSAGTYDAFFDPNCIDCTWRNPLLIQSGRGAVRAWQMANAWLALAAAVAAGLIGTGWLVGGRTRTVARIILAASALGLAVAAGLRGVLLIVAPRSDPTDGRWAASWVALAVAAMGLGLGVGALAIETWRRAARMRHVAGSLEAAPAPGTLEAALARAIGDASLRIGYWLDDDRVVDAGGASTDLPQGPSMTITPVERDGDRLALVAHRSGLDPAALALAFGPTVLVALDNERLRAARLSQLAELRASRSRIVAVGDAERRRLERDLHDGVQQQLLAVLFDLRLARLAADRCGDSSRSTALAETEARTRAAIEELRRMAHGIYPAILSRSGLLPALTTLAEAAAIPVDVVAAGMAERLPEAVEMTAYRVVAEALADAETHGAPALSVAVTGAEGPDGRIRIRLSEHAAGDDTGTPAVPVRIADRVGAAGGEVTAEAIPAGGTLLRVVLPCA